MDGAAAGAVEPPTLAKADNRRTVSSCPAGQLAGSPAALIERRTSNVSSHTRQRNS